MSRPMSLPVTQAMEAAVNVALRRVVNDGVEMADVLDDVFRAGVTAARREVEDDIATLLAELTIDAQRMRHVDDERAWMADGIERAVISVRRRTGVEPRRHVPTNSHPDLSASVLEHIRTDAVNRSAK